MNDSASVLDFHPLLAATGIGSLPHGRVGAALDLVQECVPEIPYWPQLPRLDAREDLQRQFLEGLPGAVAEEDLVFCQEAAVREAADLYAAAMGDREWLLPSAERARCLHAFTDRHWQKARALKGQLVGPVTLAMCMRDEDGLSMLHSRQMREILVHHLSLSARMQHRHLADGRRPVMLFFDEPYMSIYGTAQFPLSPEEVVELWQDVRGDLECPVGVHCCGATDWSTVARGPFDILSFDAFDYFASLVAHSSQINEFVSGGGILAWGIVPSSTRVADFSSEELAHRWMEGAQQLVRGSSLTVQDLAARSLLTPACGLGTLDVEIAEQVFRSLRDVSHLLRDCLDLGSVVE